MRSFAPEPASVAEARHFATSAMRAAGVDAGVREAGTLVTSELASNAVRHAHTRFAVAVDLHEGRVRIAVEDESPKRPVRRPAGGDAVSGRGLGIVAAVAARWGVEPCVGGKQVWAEFAVSPLCAPRG